MSYEFDFSAIWEYRALLLTGMLHTLELSAVSQVLATLIGLITAVLRLSPLLVLRVSATAYLEVFRGTPILVQLAWAYYVLPILLGIDLPTFVIGSLALSFHIGAYLAEIFRAGILAVPRGQVEAARSVGLSRTQAFRRIVLPQAVVTVIPPYLSYAVVMIKLTALVSIIGGAEFLYTINQVYQVTYRPIELYSFAAIAYFVLALPLLTGVTWIEAKLRRLWGT